MNNAIKNTSKSTADYLDTLNTAQREAVTAPLENLLVLAGAGSGKTRVLTQRIAWLIQDQQYSPFNILAVTFTNKAANEMRARIEKFLGFSAQSMWVGTFHSLSHRLLRIHHEQANLNQNFQIMDSDDQHRLIKRIINAMTLDDKKWVPKQIQGYINAKKDKGIRVVHLKEPPDMHSRTLYKIYEQYEELCRRSHLVDFAELLLRAHELLQMCPDLLGHYQSRFQHILVDEFQDTNSIQYSFIKQLAQKSCLMAVGDDDQSIYGWRGAEIDNMKKLTKDFSPLKTVRLEQNYRSTGNILAAANKLISNNDDRLGKDLWTQDDPGAKVSLYAAYNAEDERSFIISAIKQYKQQDAHYLYKDCGILYRSNAQSRVIEEGLIQAGIPYIIYGGLRFFDRAEIKDALGYLRLISNPEDDSAFERIINMPTRGIGDQTLQTLRDRAREEKISLWKAAQSLIEQQYFTPRAKNAIEQFIALVTGLKQASETLSLSELTEQVLTSSGLMNHYRNEKGEKGQTRVENLEELISAANQFSEENRSLLQDKELSALAAFLANAALESGESQSESATDYVQLMTLHSAKGLEFPVVFLTGLEEGLFPHQRCATEPDQLAEERRLCYVGMTRAMKKLYLTYAETRRLHGQEMYHRASRFISELPEEVLEEVRLRSQITRPIFSARSRTPFREQLLDKYASQERFSEKESHGLKLGQQVRHPTFGEGTVLSFEGSGEYARVQIKFKQVGAKWLVASYAKLEAI